jgi:hypothetical protein
MEFENFALLACSRPIKVSLQEASSVFDAVLSNSLTPVQRREYLERRWGALRHELTEGDQLWIFETGGTVWESKRGIARERSGTVTDFLIL